MASAPMELNTINTLFTKSEGRDKVARFFQYLCRFVIGYLTKTGYEKGSSLADLNEQATNVMKQLAGARRAHRFCKEFPVIQAICAQFPLAVPSTMSKTLDLGVDLAQKISLATFMIIDHVGWLKTVKVLKGGKRAGTGTIQLGLKFFCFSNLLGCFANLKKASELPEDQQGKKPTMLQTAFKHALIVIQTLHLSRTYETNDMLVGAAGMISSFIDAKSQWPAAK